MKHKTKKGKYVDRALAPDDGKPVAVDWNHSHEGSATIDPVMYRKLGILICSFDEECGGPHNRTTTIDLLEAVGLKEYEIRNPRRTSRGNARIRNDVLHSSSTGDLDDE